ncbi:MAG: FtsQ-type POTRA domain-containing protein [Deltaproteobacteria bacterium]|jgi:hypothetical protein|nr:FtsQ-type POTRA domain-containing protein [Deltaproteobacteria bacterium]
MGIFRDRQTVKKKQQWMKRLKQLERILLSIAIVLVGMASLYGIYRLVFFGSSFTVDRIVVEGSWRHLSAERLADLADIRGDENLFWISMDQIHDRIHQNPWVRRAAVRRRLPDTIWIYAEEHEAEAIISDSALFYVDEYGEIFKVPEGGDDRDLPVLTGVDVGESRKMKSGDREKVLEMLKLIRIFSNSEFGKGIDVSEVHFDEVDGYSLTTKKRPMQILFGHAAFDDRMSQIDKMSAAIRGHVGRITYMMVNEPGRLIVKYSSS